MKIVCDVCPNFCKLDNKQIGICRARQNIDNKIQSINYGKVTSIALDAIEKKPIYRYKSGTTVLSVGSFGCNLKCPFCQNHSISMSNSKKARYMTISKEDLVKKALELQSSKCIGLAFTYNEPLIGWEYVYDTAKHAKASGLDNIIVTNGYINKWVLKKIVPYADAINIDLKSFDRKFYKHINGNLDTIKESIEYVHNKCHLEITFLVIPNKNDTVQEITELSRWIASISKDIPLHVSRFYPAYKYANLLPTPVDTIYNFVTIAKENLNYVYSGNC